VVESVGIFVPEFSRPLSQKCGSLMHTQSSLWESAVDISGQMETLQRLSDRRLWFCEDMEGETGRNLRTASLVRTRASAGEPGEHGRHSMRGPRNFILNLISILQHFYVPYNKDMLVN